MTILNEIYFLYIFLPLTLIGLMSIWIEKIKLSKF
jgi:hypothetical protein